MAHVIADRVLESSLTAGSGVFTLAGAVLGFRAFTAVCAVTDTVPYYIEAVDDVGRPTGEYEYGLGTYSAANQLTRTTVRGSSNGGLAVAFSAGLKLVGLGIPAPNSAATRQEWRNSLGLGAGGDFICPIALGGTGTPTPSAAFLAVLNGTPLGGFRNLLINGNFAINQRRYTSGAATSGANQYTLDRWRVVTSGQNLVFDASGNGNQITAPAGGAEQVIEGVNIAGGTYVLNWTGTATATVNGTPRAKGASFVLPAGVNATVRLIGGTASEIQLEPGTQPTPFEQRSISLELILCRRYLPAFNSGSTSDVVAPMSVQTNVNGYVLYAFEVEPRVPPTGVVISSIGHFSAFNTVGALTTLSGLVFSSASRRSVNLFASVPSASFTAGGGSFLAANNVAGQLLFTGCEL